MNTVDYTHSVAEFEKRQTEKKTSKPKVVKFTEPENYKEKRSADNKGGFELKGDNSNNKKHETSCCTLM